MEGTGNEKLKELVVNGCSRLREKSCINGGARNEPRAGGMKFYLTAAAAGGGGGGGR